MPFLPELRLLVRFKSPEAINDFKKALILIFGGVKLTVKKLYYFAPDVKFENLTPTEKNLYTTVLIEPGPGPSGQQRAWIDKAFSYLQEALSVAYVHYDHAYELYAQAPPVEDIHTWWFDPINCKKALKPYTSKTKIKIAVIDTGIFQQHPDLDDFIGGGVALDFTNLVWDMNDILDPTSISHIVVSPTDNGANTFHGTHVAGIIGAISNKRRQLYMTGLAHQETLMNLRAWDEGYTNDSILAVAIYAAVENGAKVINASWGRRKGIIDEGEGSLRDAIADACSKGVVVVCAAGNSEEGQEGEDVANIIPAGFDNVIAVASVGPDSKKPHGLIRFRESNYGKNVIGAPGVSISSLDYQSKYDMLPVTGTSAAAAFVSGLVARMFAKNPNLTNSAHPASTVRNLIKYKVINDNKQGKMKVIDVDKTLGF